MALLDSIIDLIGGGGVAPDTWQDRLREAAYVSPSGNRVVFRYEDVSYNITRKGTVYNFPDAPGSFVQDMGLTSRRIPLRVIFWGDNYDLNAAVFESALGEKGVGKLEHPIYGVFNVIPFGEISRRDDLKTAANQAIFQVTFWVTIGIVYPLIGRDPSSGVLGAVDSFNTAAGQQFSDSVSMDSALEQANGKGTFLSLLSSAEEGLNAIADVTESVNRGYRASVDSINRGIDILIAKPLTLANQFLIMSQAPARAQAAIQARLDAYQNLLDRLTTGDDSIGVPGLDSNNTNDFVSNSLLASSYIAGSILSVVNNEFETRGDALNSAELILEQLEQLTAWQEANYESLGVTDTGESYQALQEAVAVTVGFLTEISFSLKQERIVILDRNRTIIDLAGELYGSVDDQLDFLINTNNLTGSEILELPKGRSIKYYV